MRYALLCCGRPVRACGVKLERNRVHLILPSLYADLLKIISKHESMKASEWRIVRGIAYAFLLQ